MENDMKKLAQYLARKIEESKEELKDYIDEALADLNNYDAEEEEKDELDDFDDETPSDTLDLQEDDFEDSIEEVNAEKTNIKKQKVKVK